MSYLCPIVRKNLTHSLKKTRRAAVPALAAAGIAALALLAGGNPVAAATDSPVAQLRSSINGLFSPPRRARRAKLKHATAVEPSRSRPAKAVRQDEAPAGRPRAARVPDPVPQ